MKLYDVGVIDYASTDITCPANPDDAWSHESTATDHSISGIRLGGYDLQTAFKPEPGVPYYLLYYLYSTGDSFGGDTGLINFVGLYRNMKLAHKSAAVMNKSKNAVVMIWDDNGKKYKEHLSGFNDYFGSFDGATVVTVSL